MDKDKLNEELKKKLEKCTTVDELVALAEAEGIELDDETLDGIAGGLADLARRSLVRKRNLVIKPVEVAEDEGGDCA